MRDYYSPQGAGVVTFGEAMGLFEAESIGRLRPGCTLSLSFGGSESNVAIGLSRLGLQATWMGVLGNDSIGDMALREMRAEGVTVLARRAVGAPTGVMVKEQPASSVTRVQYFRDHSAGASLTLDDLALEVIREAQIIHLTGVTLALSDEMPELVSDVIGMAREAGVLVSLDLNYRAALWSEESARAVYRRLLPEVDIVFAGEHEAAIAVGCELETEALAHKLGEFGPSQSIITKGSKGAMAVIDDHEYAVDGLSVSVVDTVGAGDAFVAGYLAEFLRQMPPQERLDLANAVGARVCQVPGDWEGLPYRKDLVVSSDSVQR